MMRARVCRCGVLRKPCDRVEAICVGVPAVPRAPSSRGTARGWRAGCNATPDRQFMAVGATKGHGEAGGLASRTRGLGLPSAVRRALPLGRQRAVCPPATDYREEDALGGIDLTGRKYAL